MPFKLKKGNTNILGDAQRRTMERTVERTSKEMEETMRGVAPEGRTGELRDGIEERRIDNLTRVIDGNAPHTEEVIYGTSPHIIRVQGDREDNSMRFVIGGREVFTDEVEHPGTDANPFHERALDIEQPQIPGYLAEAANQTKRELS